MYGPDGKPVRPHKWVHIRGKRQWRIGLVNDDYLIGAMLDPKADARHLLLHRSKWYERAWWRYCLLPCWSLSEWWRRGLTTDQRISILAITTSSILSIIAIIISIVALVKAG